MKLFLASSFDDVSDLFVEKLKRKPSELKVLYTANAAELYKEKPWVALDIEAFQKHGFQIEEVDLKKLDEGGLRERLDKTDIFHICGGSTLYLLKLLQDKQMMDMIRKAVQSGSVIYTGTSAGSMIACPNLSMCQPDEEEKEFAKNISDFAGLGLVNFFIVPHSQKPKYIQGIKDMMDFLPENKTPILLLNDNHAVWVEDGKAELLTK